MIIDSLENAGRYSNLGAYFPEAFAYLQSTDFNNIASGRYVVDGDNLFALVSEYHTRPVAEEKLEAHRRYIDIQFVFSGMELMGYLTCTTQSPSVHYEEDQDYMLFDEAPSYFIPVNEGMFTVFFPTDLHMPCIMSGAATPVKKVVMKVRV